MARKPMSDEQKAAMRAGREAKKEREAAAAENEAVEMAENINNEEIDNMDSTVDFEANTEQNVEPVQEPVHTPPTYTQDEVERMIAEATAKAVQQAIASIPQNQQPQVIRVATDAPVVKLLYQCECSPVNVINFGVNGKFGSITGQRGVFAVPKEQFAGEFRDEVVQKLLASRELVVLDGLTDDERELYDVKYKEGEYLDEKAFVKMFALGRKILELYPNLCLAYREMVAKRFAAEYDKNPKGMSRDLIVELNELSKKDYADFPKDDMRRKGAFFSIIEAMNRADERGE